MTETSFPFASGPGANTGEDGWAAMAARWAPDGVDPTSPAVTVGSGLTFTIPNGFSAWVRGFSYLNDAILSKTSAANTNALPVIDLLVLRLDRTSKTITTAVKRGTPAASPTPPGLTQTPTIREYPLMKATAPGSASPQNYTSAEILYEFTGTPAGDVRTPRVTGTLVRSDNALKINPNVTDLTLTDIKDHGTSGWSIHAARGLASTRSGWFRIETNLGTAYAGARYIEVQLNVSPTQTKIPVMLADTSNAGFGTTGGVVDIYVPPHQTFAALWGAYSSLSVEADIRALATRVSVMWLGYQRG